MVGIFIKTMSFSQRWLNFAGPGGQRTNFGQESPMCEQFYGECTIIGVSCNADKSLFSAATTTHFLVYSCDSNPLKKLVREGGAGGMKLAIPMYHSPIVVLVPSGDTPGTSPRRLRMWNFMTKKIVREVGFQTTIIACAISRTMLAVGTENDIGIYSLADMELIHKIDGIVPSSGVLALSAEPASHLAYSANTQQGRQKAVDTTQTGEIAIMDCNERRVVSRISAHKTAVAVIAFSGSGALLATASVTGSLVRIFTVPEGSCVQELRHCFPGSLHVLSMLRGAQDGGPQGGGAERGGPAMSARSREVTALSFCPQEQFLLSVSANASGRNGGFLNVFRVVARPGRGVSGASSVRTAMGGSSGQGAAGAGGRGAAEEEGDEGDGGFVAVEASDLPSSPSPAQEEGEGEGAGGAWAGWGRRLAETAISGARALQTLTQEYAVAAASAAGVRERVAPGQAAALYARIHNPAGGSHESESSGSAQPTSPAAEGLRSGVNFFAWLNYSAAGERLALCVVLCQGALFHRYNVGFLQDADSVSDQQRPEGTIALSDTRPPPAPSQAGGTQRGLWSSGDGGGGGGGGWDDGAGSGGGGGVASTRPAPRTLSELLEEECTLLDPRS